MEFHILLAGTYSWAAATTVCYTDRNSSIRSYDTEISNIEAFVEAMWPIAEISEVMGKEKWFYFLLFFHKLLHIHLIEQRADSNVMKGIKQSVEPDLEDRYSDP